MEPSGDKLSKFHVLWVLLSLSLSLFKFGSFIHCIIIKMWLENKNAEVMHLEKVLGNVHIAQLF
jgi:hypothetical protein